MRTPGVVVAAALTLGLGAASPGWAIPIFTGGTEVGGLDTIIAATSDLGVPDSTCVPGSNVSNEQCWANAVLDAQGSLIDLVFDEADKIDPGPTIFAYGNGSTFDTTVAAFDFGIGSAFDYYIVKNAQIWVLVKNNDDLRYGVIDGADPLITAQINLMSKPPIKFNIGDGQTKISHITPTVGGTTPVSEPASLALLGVGVLSFGLSRCRRRRTSV